MKILIADDEMLARQRLVNLIAELPTHFSILEAENGIMALKMISKESPELALLDIRMPMMDGLEVAHHLTKLKSPVAIIFTTAYEDYALEAFDMQAFAYLMKPIRKERLQQAIETTLRRVNVSTDHHDAHKNPTHLSTTVMGNLQIVQIEKIYYLQADQKYTKAVWSEGELLLDDSLKSLEEKFSSQFIRIHRNTLVALKYVLGLEKDRDGNHYIRLHRVKVRLLVSRRHVSHIRKILKHL